MVGALSFNLLVLLVRLALSQKNSKAPEKEEKKRLGQIHWAIPTRRLAGARLRDLH